MQNIRGCGDTELCSVEPKDVIVYVNGGNGAIGLLNLACFSFIISQDVL